MSRVGVNDDDTHDDGVTTAPSNHGIDWPSAVAAGRGGNATGSPATVGAAARSGSETVVVVGAVSFDVPEQAAANTAETATAAARRNPRRVERAMMESTLLNTTLNDSANS
jgi:hypothetical protein